MVHQMSGQMEGDELQWGERQAGWKSDQREGEIW